MEKNTNVLLKLFNGTLLPNEEKHDSENYWLLIGKSGKIVGTAEELNFFNKERILVQFNTSLDDLGLANHNPIKNSLWILKSDLDIIV